MVTQPLSGSRPVGTTGHSTATGEPLTRGDARIIDQLRPAVTMLVLFTIVTGVIYPLAMTALAQLAMPTLANGSLIKRDGVVIGSALIGQNFASDRYFQGRPSATSAPDPNDAAKMVDAPYNAAGSGGSNLGPLSRKLLDRVAQDVSRIKASGGPIPVPADAVTASASGLDPHISQRYAALQVARVAQARAVDPERLRRLVDGHTRKPLFGMLGEPLVNVLELNLALDDLVSR